MSEQVEKRKWAAALGTVVIVFALVGVVATGWAAVAGVNRLLNNPNKYSDYATLISPLASLDPMPFEDITAADPDTLVQAGILACLEQRNIDEMETDSLGRLILPVVELEAQAKRLFGSGIVLEYQTFGESDAFEYDELRKSYHVPAYNMRQTIVRVTKSVRAGDVTTLSVDCFYTGGEFDESDLPPNAVPDKKMVYVLRGKPNKEVISQVKIAE